MFALGGASSHRQHPKCPWRHQRNRVRQVQKGLQSLAVASVKKATEQTLKIELDDEVFDRLHGFVSHPVPTEKVRKLVVRVVSQFGEESPQVMVL